MLVKRERERERERERVGDTTFGSYLSDAIREFEVSLLGGGREG